MDRTQPEFRAWIKKTKRLKLVTLIDYLAEEIEVVECVDGQLKAVRYAFDDVVIERYTELEEKNGNELWGGDIVRAEVYRHGSGSNWYSNRNKNHGKMPSVTLAVVFGWIHGTYGWVFTDLPCTRQQIEELEKPIGRERNRQSVSKPHVPHSRCVFEIVGTIHDE